MSKGKPLAGYNYENITKQESKEALVHHPKHLSAPMSLTFSGSGIGRAGSRLLEN